MATPSAKPAATPTHLTSSPHPSSAPLSRSIAHKSPSTRTPTASGPGPAHTVSASSHQYATPLAATSAVDDPVNFSSPSALLALGGYTGISPSPAVHDGLVGSGMNENDMQSLNMQGLKLGIARDNDVEMRRRIEEVVQSFRTRVAGRGVSRESIERLSRLEGFESIWQDNDINIAGNFVDLEIEFHARHDVVKNVSLRYATPDYQEGEVREEATAVLRRNLIQTPQDGVSGNWRSLQAFYENLKWLAKLDKLSQEVNCFEALEGLEESFRKIWVEESKSGKHGGDYEHLCTGAIGRPSMHKGSRIGLGLEYWVAQAKALDAKKQKTSPDAMAIDRPQDQGADEVDDQNKTWQVMVECEEGYPSLRISKEWVANDVFTAGEKSESSPQTGAAETVNWLDPPQTTRLSHGNHPDPMALDSSMLESSPPNRRFVAKLEPPLDVPILAAVDIYRQLGMQLPQEYRMVTYEDLLLANGPPSTQSTKLSPRVDGRKRRMSVQTFDSTGAPSTKHHNYAFVVFESVAGRTIRDLPFSHPRQLAEILPVFRQYAFIASLFRKVFSRSATDEKTDKREAAKATASDTLSPTDEDMPFITGKEGIITLSNENHNEDKLDYLLSGAFPAPSGNTFLFSSETRSLNSNVFTDDVKVDVTLSPQLERPPALMILITDPSGGSKEPLREPIRVSICFHIGLNGRVSVEDSSGLEKDINESGDAEMQGTDEHGSQLCDIHRKLARVLEISQDLGILVEWVLRWVRQRDGRG